jgi:hypothetical protein
MQKSDKIIQKGKNMYLSMSEFLNRKNLERPEDSMERDTEIHKNIRHRINKGKIQNEDIKQSIM